MGHIPVLLEEVCQQLNLKNGDIVIDGTAGGGGHTVALAEIVGPQGKIIAIDRDEKALEIAEKRVKSLGSNIFLVHGNYNDLKRIVIDRGFSEVQGILLDLGLSSMQLDIGDRGFSFNKEANLDMRFDNNTETTARDIVNTYAQKELADLFRNYGEERLASPIAKMICDKREDGPIQTTMELATIINEVYSRFYRRNSKTNPATKVFQALRIEVNQELDSLRQVLPDAVDILSFGGRLAVISYHSLEDKIVKDFFKRENTECLCPPQLPVCRCGHQRSVKLVNKKPIVPSDLEITNNPRSRSAKLRVVEKIK